MLYLIEESNDDDQILSEFETSNASPDIVSLCPGKSQIVEEAPSSILHEMITASFACL